MRTAVVCVVVVGTICMPAMAADWDFFESFDNRNFYKPDGVGLTSLGNGWNGYWSDLGASSSPAVAWDGGYYAGPTLVDPNDASDGVSTDANAVGEYYGAYINSHPDRTPYGPELWSPALGSDGEHSAAQVHGNIYMDTTGTEYREAFIEIRTDPNIAGQGFGEAGERYLRIGYVANDPDEGNQDYYFWAWKDDNGEGILTSLDPMTGLNVYEDPNNIDQWVNFGFGYNSWQDPDLSNSNISIMVFEGTGNDVQDPNNWLFTAGWWPLTVDIANPGALDTYAFNGTGTTVAWDNFGVSIGIPEPVSALLLIGGGLAVLRRRQR